METPYLNVLIKTIRKSTPKQILINMISLIKLKKSLRHCKIFSRIEYLGTPETIGELKNIIKDYPDITSFGFRNQPIQSLYDIENSKFVVFQEKENL